MVVVLVVAFISMVSVLVLTLAVFGSVRVCVDVVGCGVSGGWC